MITMTFQKVLKKFIKDDAWRYPHLYVTPKGARWRLRNKKQNSHHVGKKMINKRCFIKRVRKYKFFLFLICCYLVSKFSISRHHNLLNNFFTFVAFKIMFTGRISNVVLEDMRSVITYSNQYDIFRKFENRILSYFNSYVNRITSI